MGRLARAVTRRCAEEVAAAAALADAVSGRTSAAAAVAAGNGGLGESTVMMTGRSGGSVSGGLSAAAAAAFSAAVTLGAAIEAAKAFPRLSLEVRGKAGAVMQSSIHAPPTRLIFHSYASLTLTQAEAARELQECLSQRSEAVDRLEAVVEAVRRYAAANPLPLLVKVEAEGETASGTSRSGKGTTVAGKGAAGGKRASTVSGGSGDSMSGKAAAGQRQESAADILEWQSQVCSKVYI